MLALMFIAGLVQGAGLCYWWMNRHNDSYSNKIKRNLDVHFEKGQPFFYYADKDNYFITSGVSHKQVDKFIDKYYEVKMCEDLDFVTDKVQSILKNR